MSERLTSSSVGPAKSSAPRSVAGAQTVGLALLSYLPLVGLMLAGGTLAAISVYAGDATALGSVLFPPLVVVFLGGQYLAHREAVNRFGTDAGGSAKGIGSLLKNYKQIAPMLQMGGAGGEAALGGPPTLPEGGPGAGLGGGLGDAMAAWGHAKTAYGAMKKASSQFALFLVVFCIARVGLLEAWAAGPTGHAAAAGGEL